MQVIRDLLTPKTYVIVVEHDLAVLDYLSDFICCLYGKPGIAYCCNLGGKAADSSLICPAISASALLISGATSHRSFQEGKQCGPWAGE